MAKKQIGKRNSAKSAGGAKKRGGGSGGKSKDIFEADDEPKGRNSRRKIYGDDDGGASASDSDDDGNHPKFRKAKDDESVDDDGSDIGWDSEDELMYGKILGHRDGGADAEESEDDDDISDQEEPEEGEMLLSDILGGGSKKSNSSSSNKRKQEEESEDEEEESEEDEEDGFEYDYEDKLGNPDGDEDDYDDEDEEEAEDSDADEDGGDLDAVHNRLLSAIDHFATKRGDRAEKDNKNISKLQQIGESQFSSAAESWGNDQVTMDALLGALDGEQSLSVVKKRLGELEKGMGAPVYVEKVHADRAERAVGYESSQKDMDKWKDVVTANRQAKTLDIAGDVRVLPNYKNLVRQFKPETSMEKEIQMVLVKTGATDKQAKDREDDELGKRNLTVAELRQRQAELAKTRALLFYEQMKNHRINKIKSKAYHRIKKRQRVRKGQEERLLQEQDPDMLEKLNEEAATQRVLERMNFRHKSTGKFAKNMLNHSHGDKSMREAFNDTVNMGKEMLEKIEEDPFAKGKGEDSDGGYSDSDEEGENNGKSNTAAAKAARALRRKGVIGDDEEETAEVKGKYKKLFEMDFMKKAKEQQKERAREEAQNVLAEIERMEGGSDYDSDASVEDPKKGKMDAKALAAAKKELKEQMKGNGSGFSSLRIKGKSRQFKTFDGEEEGEGAGEGEGEEERDGDDSDEETEQQAQGNKKGKKVAFAENPWLNQPATQSGRSSRSGSKRGEDQVYVSLDGLIGAEKPNGNSAAGAGKNARKKAKKMSQYTAAGGQDDNASYEKESKNAMATVTTAKKQLTEEKSQESIVQMAFAGPDLESEFATFKDAKISEELGVDKKRKAISQDVKAGWGDWAGPGENNMISQKILNVRDRKMKMVEDEADLKKKGRKDTKMANVLLSDRRIKTAAKFKIAEIPHPFTTREEYEQSLKMPIGEEWNASHVVRSNTKPEIFMRAGRVVEPIKLGKQRSKPDATAAGAGGGNGLGSKTKAGKVKNAGDKFKARSFKGF